MNNQEGVTITPVINPNEQTEERINRVAEQIRQLLSKEDLKIVAYLDMTANGITPKIALSDLRNVSN